jgi:mono/diheme cytochrome c family protein
MFSRAAGCLAGLALGWLAGHAGAATNPQDFTQIERGRYLAILGDCGACHTVPGGKPFAGGRAVETPFGNVLSSNLTPDKETGIGDMTDDDFVSAVTRGVAHGTHLYPAMPYTYFSKMPRADVLAIRAYLNTVEPERNKVETNQLPFPFSIRGSMIVWNWLFYDDGKFVPVAGKSEPWNRGAYLVEGPMHCGMCHTPKNFLGGDRSADRLAGYALQGWFAPDITNDGRRGLGTWSADDIVAYLKTGHNRFSAGSGPMAEEIVHSSSQITDGDLQAIAAYLKDQSGKGEPAPSAVAANDPAMKLGAAIFGDECAACHTPSGKGIPSLFPDLAGSPAVQSADPTSILHIILDGARSVGTAGAPTAPAMPGFRMLLNDREIAAVATYIRNAWGNAALYVSEGDVSDMRDALAHRSE